MTRKLSNLLPWLIAFPIPPRYIGRATLALCLTVVVMALARLHSFPGVLIAAGLAVGLMMTLGVLRRRLRKTQ